MRDQPICGATAHAIAHGMPRDMQMIPTGMPASKFTAQRRQAVAFTKGFRWAQSAETRSLEQQRVRIGVPD